MERGFVEITQRDNTLRTIKIAEIDYYDNNAGYIKVTMKDKTIYSLPDAMTKITFAALLESNETLEISSEVHMVGEMEITDIPVVHSIVDSLPNLTISDITNLNIDSMPVQHHIIDSAPVLHTILDSAAVQHNVIDSSAVIHNVLDSLPSVTVINGVTGLNVAQSIVAVTNSSTTLLSANSGRKALTIQNQNPTSKVWLRFGGSTATTSNSELLLPLCTKSFPDARGFVYTGEIRAIGDTSVSKNIYIMEGT